MASGGRELRRTPEMPVEILSEILNYVECAATLLACAQVNKTFSTLSIPRLWRGHLTDARMGPTSQQLVMMGRNLGRPWLQDHLRLIQFMHVTTSLTRYTRWEDVLVTSPAIVAAKPRALTVMIDDRMATVKMELLQQLLHPGLFSLSLLSRHAMGACLSLQRFRLIRV